LKFDIFVVMKAGLIKCYFVSHKDMHCLFQMFTW